MIKRPRAVPNICKPKTRVREGWRQGGTHLLSASTQRQNSSRAEIPLRVRETYAPRTTIRLVVSETETINPTNARVKDGAVASMTAESD